MSQSLNVSDERTDFAPCACGNITWLVEADSGVRTCSLCQTQVAFIEEGIEDDQIDQFRTTRGRFMHRKKGRVKHVEVPLALPAERDVLFAVKHIFLVSVRAVSSRHGFPEAPLVSLAERRWSSYVEEVKSRLPYSILQVFVRNSGRPKKQKEEKNEDAINNSSSSSSSSSPPWDAEDSSVSAPPPPLSSTQMHKASQIARLDAQRAKRKALRDAGTSGGNGSCGSPNNGPGGTQAPLVLPSMQVVIAAVLACAREASLPLFAADLVRAVR